MLLLRAQAQQPGASVTTLSLSARLVVLDVTVEDAAGHPVPGLNAKDFEVLEDGRSQRIRSVEPPASHTLPAMSEAAGLSAVFDPASPASFGRSPVDVLVLDQLNTHFADSSFARRALLDYLAKQPALLPAPTTLLTVYDNRFKTLAPFTRNRDLLTAALKAAPTEYAWKLETFKNAEYGPLERLDQTLRTLVEIAQQDAAIAGRKNLLWVGGGFPTLDPTTIDGKDAAEVKAALQHVTDVLLDTRVTLYAVDPTTSASSMTEVIDPSQMAFVQAAGDGLTVGADPFSTTGDFDRLGPVTGGRVVRGMNDVAGQIGSALALGGDYYTIAYSPDSASSNAMQYRRIEVRCLRPGLTLTTRAGYYSGAATEANSAETASYDLSTAAESPTRLNALHITAEPDPASPGTYRIHAGAAALSWKPDPDGSSEAGVYVMAVSLNAKGKMLTHVVEGMTAHAKAGVNLREAGQSATFLITAPPSPRAVTLRFIVRDSATGRMGSADVPLAAH